MLLSAYYVFGLALGVVTGQQPGVSCSLHSWSSESERQASLPCVRSLVQEQRQEPRAVRPGLLAFCLPCCRMGCFGTGFQQRRQGNASRGNDVCEGPGPCIGERCVVGHQGLGRDGEM